MLEQTANYSTIISQTTTIRNCTSLNDIWVKICEYYGFQTTGSCFLDLSQIKLQVSECHEIYINVWFHFLKIIC